MAEKEWHCSHTLRINNTSSLLYFLQGQKNVLLYTREVDIDELDMFFGIVRSKDSEDFRFSVHY